MGNVLFGTDPDPHSAHIVRRLATLGAPGGCVWEEVQSGGVTFWLAAALCDANDEIVAHPLHPDEPSRRAWFQRDNLLLARGTDKLKVLWEAERLHLATDQITVWRSRLQQKYVFVPRAPREGALGIPRGIEPDYI